MPVASLASTAAIANRISDIRNTIFRRNFIIYTKGLTGRPDDIVIFNATKSVGSRSNLEISEKPIENSGTGAIIGEHSTLRPTTISIEAVISNNLAGFAAQLDDIAGIVGSQIKYLTDILNVANSLSSLGGYVQYVSRKLKEWQEDTRFLYFLGSSFDILGMAQDGSEFILKDVDVKAGTEMGAEAYNVNLEIGEVFIVKGNIQDAIRKAVRVFLSI